MFDSHLVSDLVDTLDVILPYKSDYFHGDVTCRLARDVDGYCKLSAK